MVPLFYCQNLKGFRSVYLFNEKDAMEIKGKQSSAGFDKYEICSQQLFIDLDGKEAFEKAEHLFDKYRRQDFSIEVWFSGSKGFHIVVDIEEMSGDNVPYSQKKFVQNEVGVNYCDESIYKSSALIRLPHTRHEKTGNQKHLIMKNNGEVLMSIASSLNKKEPIINNINFNLGNEQKAWLEILRLSSMDVGEGRRHVTLFYTAGLLARAGYSYSTVKEILMRINSNWKNPKSEIECEKSILQGYRKPINEGGNQS